MNGVPGVILGRRIGPFPGCIDGELVRQYAAATGDPTPDVAAGRVVPPVAVVTQIWAAQNEARQALVPSELQQQATGGVHGEHDIVLHRPIVPGEPLAIWVEGYGARPAGRNALVTLRYAILDAGDDLVCEQWWTTVWLGVTCAAVGPAPPDHAFPPDGRDRPVGRTTVAIDSDMARRYAEVSGDWSAHHFDMEAARRSGFERPFLHGLCTMAVCGHAVCALIAGGDPERVRRLAVRFATPMFLDEELDVQVYDAGPGGYAFEATSAGATVISHGRAELW